MYWSVVISTYDRGVTQLSIKRIFDAGFATKTGEYSDTPPTKNERNGRIMRSCLIHKECGYIDINQTLEPVLQRIIDHPKEWCSRSILWPERFSSTAQRKEWRQNAK